MRQTPSTETTIKVEGRRIVIHSLQALEDDFPAVATLPFSLKILLENLLRHVESEGVSQDDIAALANWDPAGTPSHEIAFRPARVLLQDFTGVPAVVDLATMREALSKHGGDAAKINPVLPAELVIDHSIQVDLHGSKDAFHGNTGIEFAHNRERYSFLRWAQNAFRNFRVVPPATGIVHQVNLEYLASVVFTSEDGEFPSAYPDTLIGTDSHTTMINGLGVLGWGVGGIEAEAAMLGQPVSMLVPQVVGCRLYGALQEGTTATDLVLTVTELLRKQGVVDMFVEFFGPGLSQLSLADRATIANMSPEYGATCGFFPVDKETLEYLRLTGRAEQQVRLVEAYCKAQGLFYTDDGPQPRFSDIVELDMAAVEPSLAGPTRPQDRISLRDLPAGARRYFKDTRSHTRRHARNLQVIQKSEQQGITVDEQSPCAEDLVHGSIVIAAITSCTNTSNPSVMFGAGILAKKAVERGLETRPWVKASLAPGSRVVTDYLRKAGLLPYLEALGFHLVGYGCTTCIGNSGPLPPPVSDAIRKRGLVVASVLSGNRNFEGRVHSEVRMNFLASPPLVVAFALAGRIDVDLEKEAVGKDKDGQPVYLKDIWPSGEEIKTAMSCALEPEMFVKEYESAFKGSAEWNALPTPSGVLYEWDANSTYVRRPPFFDDFSREPGEVEEIRGARVLCFLGDSVTTDHISPAGAIPVESPAGQYLLSNGVRPADFNSYGARRGNHEVMMRGTFANIRLRNRLVPGVEGGFTRHFPDAAQMTIFDAARKYAEERVPLIVIAGKEYGAGSSRDWAAKGPRLLGVRAVIAESYERIHRSNLIGMGILPLEFEPGETADSLGLTGEETFDIEGLADAIAGQDVGPGVITVRASGADGRTCTFHTRPRLDTPQEVAYYQHGGILQYVLRQLLGCT